jgi:ABC-type multidrug transport system ATPase subunit
MKQRLLLIKTLLKEADVYLFDEPTIAFDYTSEERLIRIFKELTSGGSTVIVATNDLSFAKRAFSNFLLLNEGRKILEGTHNGCCFKRRGQGDFNMYLNVFRLHKKIR